VYLRAQQQQRQQQQQQLHAQLRALHLPQMQTLGAPQVAQLQWQALGVQVQ
jgi:hypothetical protein